MAPQPPWTPPMHVQGGTCGWYLAPGLDCLWVSALGCPVGGLGCVAGMRGTLGCARLASGLGCSESDLGCSVHRLGCLVGGLGCSVHRLGCSVHHLGCLVGGLGCSVSGLGCLVRGLGCLLCRLGCSLGGLGCSVGGLGARGGGRHSSGTSCRLCLGSAVVFAAEGRGWGYPERVPSFGHAGSVVLQDPNGMLRGVQTDKKGTRITGLEKEGRKRRKPSHQLAHLFVWTGKRKTTQMPLLIPCQRELTTFLRRSTLSADKTLRVSVILDEDSQCEWASKRGHAGTVWSQSGRCVTTAPLNVPSVRYWPPCPFGPL